MTRGRAIGLALTVLLFAAAPAPAAAIGPPDVVTGPPPPDPVVAPEFPMKQNTQCQTAGVLPASDLAQPPPADLALRLRQARALSRGAGVTVAVVDTGVHPNPRLPNLSGGGDFVVAGDGLTDCDAHGTLVAGIIGAASDPADGFAGVAPDARIIAIRAHSAAFTEERPIGQDPVERLALPVRTLARAITHAAYLGAGVIVVPSALCVPVDLPVDQTSLAAAIGFAVYDRGALIVAGAGDTAGSGSSCAQNPGIDPAHPADPRNWAGVKTIAVPGWFAPAVLTVGFTTADGTPVPESLNGPWVLAAAPGTGIESLGPDGAGLVNGIGPPGKLAPIGGPAFAAAYVGGVAALVRSRYPNENPADIIARLVGAAHAPARRIDNAVGAGVIDPLAALSYRTPPAAPAGLFRAAELPVPPPRPGPDTRPRRTALIVIAVIAALGLCVVLPGRTSRRAR
ncbi:type VII secretion-associated serine protease mycosin [Nocardia sp. NPDC051832]|uniref:type VII secretion-associated serine protease mycosin n=1 Tax=Nocardia sp. NPDC051832 TaxID=3155673 RepID=UPI003430F022